MPNSDQGNKKAVIGRFLSFTVDFELFKMGLTAKGDDYSVVSAFRSLACLILSL
jgi:hypothetical protein